MAYLSYGDFTTIKDLKKYIKNVICGSPVRLFLGEHYWLPSSESIRILQNDDLVLVKSRLEDVTTVKTEAGKKRRRSQLEEDDVPVSKIVKKSLKAPTIADKTSPKLKTKESVDKKRAKVVEKSENKIPDSGQGKKIMKDVEVKSSSSESESSSSDEEETKSDSRKTINGTQKTNMKNCSNSLAKKVASLEKKASVAVPKSEETSSSESSDEEATSKTSTSSSTIYVKNSTTSDSKAPIMTSSNSDEKETKKIKPNQSSSSDSSDEEEQEVTMTTKSSCLVIKNSISSDSKPLNATPSNSDEKKIKKRKRKRQPKNKNKLPKNEIITMLPGQQQQKTEPLPKVPAASKKELKAAPLPSQETLWSNKSQGRNVKTFRHQAKHIVFDDDEENESKSEATNESSILNPNETLTPVLDSSEVERSHQVGRLSTQTKPTVRYVTNSGYVTCEQVLLGQVTSIKQVKAEMKPGSNNAALSNGNSHSSQMKFESSNSTVPDVQDSTAAWSNGSFNNSKPTQNVISRQKQVNGKSDKDQKHASLMENLLNLAHSGAPLRGSRKQKSDVWMNRSVVLENTSTRDFQNSPNLNTLDKDLPSVQPKQDLSEQSESPSHTYGDISTLPLLKAPPQENSIIGFKLLEISANYTPGILYP